MGQFRLNGGRYAQAVAARGARVMAGIESEALRDGVHRAKLNHFTVEV
ncbi:hypothetical protein NAV33_18285 [Pseudomonas stutzeri]|nr:hypothetical protein [Stutzerimonas stutzeri]MCQ4313821.1 hypothetical protein [Stutzerimonas stutzeri]